MFKKILLLTTLLFCLFNLNAQTKRNMKLGIETGIIPLSSNSYNLGLFLYVEPKIKVLKNTFIGLRFGLTLNSHTFENNSFQFNIDDEYDNAVISFVPTFDYYLNENKYRPYIGLGLGYHVLPDPIDVFRVVTSPSEEALLEGKANKRVGFLLRGGFEFGKLRVGLEYTFMPKADIKVLNDQIIGTVDNNYLGLSIGFIIGNGKNSK